MYVQPKVAYSGMHLERTGTKNEASGGRRLSILTVLLKGVKNTKQRIETSLITTRIFSSPAKRIRNLLDTLRHTDLPWDRSSFSQARSNPDQNENRSGISEATNLSGDTLLPNACGRSGGSGGV